MSFDELIFIAKGFLSDWNKAKLETKIKELATITIDTRIKNTELEDKVKNLEDEIRLLKSEKAKPKFKPKKVSTKDLNPDLKIDHSKKSKKDSIEIDQEIEVDVAKDDLPGDAKFIGKRDIVIQEMVIERKNIRFVIKRYWSEEQGKVIEGEIPEKYKGSEFGPLLKSFIIYLYYKNRVPQKKIMEMLSDWGIKISKGTICNILNNTQSVFEDDLKSARKAALKKCPQVHIDETGAKYNGSNAYTFVVGNDYFTSFTTGLEKNRWAATQAILLSENSFVINDFALQFIANKLKNPKIIDYLKMFEQNKNFNREFIEKILSDFEMSKYQKDIIKTGCALGALRATKDGSRIKFMITDDAPNFMYLIENHQLCWVHEIRKYKLFNFDSREKIKVMDDLHLEWRYFYKLMKEFKVNPIEKLRFKIKYEFERICSMKTYIRLVDDQLARTKANKEKLLLFLTYPQLPLHNNMAETDVRERVIKRKISLQNRSKKGMRAWDLMLSLVSTCRKIKISFWRYLEDRQSKKEAIPFLGKVLISHFS